MAEDTLDTFVAPRYRKQKATPSSKETKAAIADTAKFAAEMVFPQSLTDAGLMLIPGGKFARKAGAALIALDAGDAEAGALTKLLKGNIVKDALEEARNKLRKLQALKDEGKYTSWLADDNEYPTRFYRGMSAMVKGGENSPKYFDDLTAKYLNSSEPLSSLDSLVAAQRPPGAMSDNINMRKNNAWAASNPLTAASYASTPNSIMVPLELTQKPGAVFDAQGLHWVDFFSQTGRLTPYGNYHLRTEYKDALRDPQIKSILVKNILDSGAGDVDELSHLYGIDIGRNDLISSNILIKDPSVVRYGISGEVPNLKEPKVKKAEGGVVHMGPGGLLNIGKAAKVASKAMTKAPANAALDAKLAAELMSTPTQAEAIVKSAPSIIIPSKLTNVKDAVRRNMGEYGARRVERAADEVPNLERMYSEEALRQAFSGDNAKAMMTMNPADFEKFAIPLTFKTDTYLSPQVLAKRIKSVSADKFDMPTADYVKYLANINKFNDVTSLTINKEEAGLQLMPFLSGHEGRHRNRAMASKGEQTGLVQLLPRAKLREPFPRRSQQEYIEALKKELEMTGNMVQPEKYHIDIGGYTSDLIVRPPIELPDLYAEGGIVHMGIGGSYPEQDTVSATPQNAILGAIARGLQGGADQMSKPVTYQFGKRSTVATPPTALLSELMAVPALARTAERMSYGEPLTSGRGQTLRPLNDTTDAFLTVAPMAGPLARIAGKATKAGARVVGQELNRAMLDNSGPLAKFIPEAVKPAYVVPPQGNLNLTPMARAEALKGSDTQPLASLLNKVQMVQGVTKEGFAEIANRYADLAPNTRMTKAEFEKRIPASQYNKVDLAGAAENDEVHLLDQATEMAREDRYGVYEGVLERLGVSNRPDNLRMLDEYHNYPTMSTGELSQNSELYQALKQAGMDSPEGRQLLDDLFQEEHDNLINYFYEDLLGQNSGFKTGKYRYGDHQRLLVNPETSENGYFEIGVTHPTQQAPYNHYPVYEGDEGLIGHVRGTLIPADATDEARRLFSIRLNDEKIFAKPNSMVIEEIQSDAQGKRGANRTGALHQAHGTMFKAAIQHALENGVDTVYYPTAKTIGGARFKESSAYAPIYDQQVVKEGLNPLLKIPGVSSEKIGDSWIKINFTPEANDLILKGEGQVAPGYAEGGMVEPIRAYDPLKIDAIMASIDAPRNYAEGGEVYGPESEVYGPDIKFKEDPEAMRLYEYATKQIKGDLSESSVDAPDLKFIKDLKAMSLYKNAMRQNQANKEDSVSNFGIGMQGRVGDGNFSAGLDINNMTQGHREKLMKALVANYNINLGDINLNSRIQKPLDAKDVYVGMINGSIPLAEGRAMLGIQGVKNPYGKEVLGYNAGWSGKVGPGNLNANVNIPKRGSKSVKVQYQIPFAEGGSVRAYDSGRIDAIVNQFM